MKVGLIICSCNKPGSRQGCTMQDRQTGAKSAAHSCTMYGHCENCVVLKAPHACLLACAKTKHDRLCNCLLCSHKTNHRLTKNWHCMPMVRLLQIKVLFLPLTLFMKTSHPDSLGHSPGTIVNRLWYSCAIIVHNCASVVLVSCPGWSGYETSLVPTEVNLGL